MKCLDKILESEMERENSVNILSDNFEVLDLIIGEKSIFEETMDEDEEDEEYE